MTLIATMFDRNGIVLATDSNLTSNDKVTREARKNFELPHLRGGLSIAGAYSVEGVPMDDWMPEFIARPGTYEKTTLVAFADCLRKAFENEMSCPEKQIPTIAHLAGYFTDKNGYHPEFHHIRNSAGMDEQSGNYFGTCGGFPLGRRILVKALSG